MKEEEEEVVGGGLARKRAHRLKADVAAATRGHDADADDDDDGELEILEFTYNDQGKNLLVTNLHIDVSAAHVLFVCVHVWVDACVCVFVVEAYCWLLLACRSRFILLTCNASFANSVSSWRFK